MEHLSAIRRISLGIVCLTFGVYLAASWLGLLPDRVGPVVRGREALCEAVAIDCSLAVQSGNFRSAKQALRAIVDRNPELLSGALRTADGRFLVEAGNHRAYWAEKPYDRSDATHMFVPIHRGSARWGSLELCFRTPDRRDPWGLVSLADARLVVFVAVVSFLIYYVYLRRVLRYLNPSKVIPQRVRNTLDTLVEGLLVLDNDQRIILANEAFARMVGESPAGLQGRRAAELPWKQGPGGSSAEDYPWALALRDGQRRTGTVLKLVGDEFGTRTFCVNSSPILGDDGASRGALATFDDITLLEERNATLSDTLSRLKESKEQVHRQNEQLTTLATRDPLTLCLNRRAFFEQFDEQLRGCQQAGRPFSCIMVDLDHFKQVNDDHGHAVGDQVLKVVADVLRSALGQRGAVGRYGGEEFCAILPGLDAEEAVAQAETIRRTIQDSRSAGLSVTASLGLSTFTAGGGVCQQHVLVEQADKAMYAAKRMGRNRVVHWERIPEGTEFRGPQRGPSVPPGEGAQEPVPFRAVAVLLSAVHYRHPDMAEHCRRVADLCVAVAGGLMSEGDRYLLEVAALLHDVGKLGLPDAILMKPGPLTEAERKVVRTYEQIGVEILATAFASTKLTDVVRHQHAWFAPDADRPQPVSGKDIPLAARILFIAEAYDAMVVDQVYRPGRSHEEAVAELRDCAGTQFDPELVQRFAATVESSSLQPGDARPGVSKQAALGIGLEIEKLACALDTKDVSTLTAMAGNLKATAARHDLGRIARAAADLQSQAAEDCDWAQIVELGADLLELCRSTQSALLDGGELMEPAACAGA